jgi:hypothetical protein
MRFDSPYDKSVATSYGMEYSAISGYFDGLQRGEIFDAQNINLLTNTGNSLFDCWVKRDGNDGQWTILCNHWADSDNRWSIAFTPSNQLHIEAYNAGNNVLYLDGGSVTSDSNWHRVSVLRRGSRVAIYVDKTRVAIGDITASVTPVGSFFVGSDGFNNSGYRFMGSLKDMIITESIFYDIDIEDSNAQLPDWKYPANWVIL